PKGCHWHRSFLHLQLVITRPQVYLREHFSPLQLIEEIVYPWKWVTILDRRLVQPPIVNTHPHRPILLLHKQHRCPPR
ncbi:hypothetical protein LINPERPRIM_LOCUS30606, partial [Linum perenne]